MQGVKLFFGVCFGVLVFWGCDDQKVELSDGNKTNTQALQEAESMDKVSYAGLENVFLDTKTLAANHKPMVFIFGKNNCVYCDKLKDDIKANLELQNILRDNFASYYINIDYSKIHNLLFDDTEPREIDTLNLAREYNIRPTPTLIFLDSTGKVFFMYPGYLTPSKFQALLQSAQNYSTIDSDDVQNIASNLSAVIDSTR